jgi:short-subunit dehydrogenase
MKDQRTILITGATDGLGRALAGGLAAGGAQLILHGRDPGRLRATADEITGQHGGPAPLTVTADLADLAQVNRLADRSVSADGYELRFAVNYLAGFALTLHLLPLLRDSAPARDPSAYDPQVQQRLWQLSLDLTGAPGLAG